MSARPGRDAAIQAFFDEAGFAGLRLPGGWFGGRGTVMDGLSQLTCVVDRPQHLIIELDSHVLLIISGKAVVDVGRSTLALPGGTPTLTISGFSQLVVDRLGYGDLLPHVDVFQEGSVQFVSTH